MKNYYEILEVNEKASDEVIEKAYKVLVKRYHPDLNASNKQYAERKIKEINEAYDILTDKFLRNQYDLELEKEKNKKYQETQNKVNQVHSQPRKEKVVNQKKQNNKNEKEINNNNVGTIYGIIDLCKELIKSKPKREEIKKVTQKDLLAVGLTILAMILLGIILWFLPFTNGWMRELLFENAVFNWIGNLFS